MEVRTHMKCVLATPSERSPPDASCSGMKAAERKSPYQVALTTQATDLRNLLAAMLDAEMLVLCIAVSASDEDGVVRPADDPHCQKEVPLSAKQSSIVRILKEVQRNGPDCAVLRDL